MHYPSELVEAIKAQTVDLKLEDFLEGAGPLHPHLMIVGEAPGREEIESHIPFHGASGKELMRFLNLAGYKREDVYITSVVRSRPYSVKQVKDRRTGKIVTKYPNRTPSNKEVRIYAPLFDWELHQVQPDVIIPVGNTALHRLLGPDEVISAVHGQLIQHPVLEFNSATGQYQWSQASYQIVPTYHPAAVLYRRQLMPTVEADWQQLSQLV